MGEIFEGLADLVSGLKAALELISNIANVLSGLAYAFAIIAGIGMIFCPFLAFLAPAIPPALNFGRLCGAVGSAASGIATLLTPLPPLFRGIGVLVSSDDPVHLVEQQQKFSKEAEGAIVGYATAAASAKIKGESANPYKLMKSTAKGVKDSVKEIGAAGKDIVHGSPEMKEAIGMKEGKLSREEKREVGDNLVHGRQNEEHVKARNDAEYEANQRLEPTEETSLNNANARLKEDNEVMHRGSAEGSAAGNAPDIVGDYVGKKISGEKKEKKEGEKEEKEEPLRKPKVKGKDEFIDLNKEPPPEGGLEKVDAKEEEEKSLIVELEKQRHVTHSAGAMVEDTTITETTLTVVVQQTETFEVQNQSLAPLHAKVAEQNAQVSQQDEQGQAQTSGSMGQAASALLPLVGPAQMTDNLLQKMPSNRYMNVDGAKRNVHAFRQGLDTVTGAGPSHEKGKGQTKAVAAARNKQAAQAKQAAAKTSADTAKLAGKVNMDKEQNAAAKAQAKQVRAQSQAGEKTLEQKLAEAKKDKQEMWAQLVQWADWHKQLRSGAKEGGEHAE